MNKIINAILAIGTAIIISLFFILAMKMAYHTDWEKCYEKYETPLRVEKNISEQQQQQELAECNKEIQELRESENKKIFITSVIIGIVLILLILPLLFIPSLAAGVGAAGIFLTIYGFARGWETSGDLIKLVLLFITAVLIIGITLFLNKSKTNKKKRNFF